MESYLSSGSPYSYVGGATAFLPIGSKSKGNDKGELSLVLAPTRILERERTLAFEQD